MHLGSKLWEGRSDVPSKTEIAERITSYRHRASYTQAFVAERMGVSANTVMNWESGRSLPNLERLKKLARLFHTQPVEIIGEVRLAAMTTAEAKTKKDRRPSARAADTQLRMGAASPSSPAVRTFATLTPAMQETLLRIADEITAQAGATPGKRKKSRP